MNDALFAELGGLFEARDRKLFLVGGSVRDMVLGREPKDLDFTTDALPDEIERILKDWADATWDVGKDFGTIAARKGTSDVEITTFRFDGPGRKPEVVFTDSLEEDLIRRDFTINAMALEVTATGLEGMNADGTRNGSFGFINRNNFVDPFDGFQALRNGILDTPRPPEQSFDDDPLRMLRAARFVSQLGFHVSERVFRTMKAMAPRLNDISAERIAAEMDKLLMGERPSMGLSLLHNSGLLKLVLPELDGTSSMHGWGDDVITRWADLLREVNPQEIEIRLRALKFSTDRVRAVTLLVELFNRFSFERANMDLTDEQVRHVICASGPLLHRLQVLLQDGELNLRVAALLASEGVPEPFLTGNEVMGLLSLKPGPEVGKAMRWLWNLRLEMGPMDHEDVVAALMDWDKVNA